VNPDDTAPAPPTSSEAIDPPAARAAGVVERVREAGADFSPRSLPATLAGGVVAGFVAVAVTISFAALVFGEHLEEHLPLGFGLALFGSAVIGVITALGSSFRGAVAGAQDNVTAILAVAVGAVAVKVTGPQTLPTALATIVAATTGMGLILYAIGRLRLGALARYMPFPVVGGFLVATGLLLVDGGASLLTAGRSGGDLLTFPAVMLWGPGLGLGVAMYLAGRYRPGTLLAPLVLLGTAAVLRLGFVVGGIGRDEAMARSWLFGPFPGDVTWSPRTLRLLGDADWGVVAGEWVSLLSIAVVAAVSLLLYVHAFEHESSTEVDVNRELRVAGVAGIAAGAAGGLPGYLYFSDSALVLRISGPRRGAALIAALTSAGVLLMGATVLGLVPRAVVGGVIIGIGLAFVIEWLWDARRSLGRVDHALVTVIALATVVAGFLAAIAAGVIIAIGLFVVRYSKVDVVRRVYSLDRTSSTLERDREQREVLAEHGGVVRIVEVRGFLFFGTATSLFDERRLAPEPGAPDLRYAVFDMKGVGGIDSSLAMALPRLERAARRRGVTLIFAGIPERLLDQVEAALAGHTAEVKIMDDLDAALHWCEDRVLDDVTGSHEAPTSSDLGALLTTMIGEGGATAVLRHATTITVAAGDRLITGGEPSAGLYFLEAGRMRVVLERAGRPPALLRQLLPGAIIGEVGLYRRAVASASVLADTECVLRMLATADIELLDRADPAAAAAIHHFAASVLADRVLHAERATRSTS
jgi:sulfate permease, SulP family